MHKDSIVYPSVVLLLQKVLPFRTKLLPKKVTRIEPLHPFGMMTTMSMGGDGGWDVGDGCWRWMRCEGNYDQRYYARAKRI